MRNLLWKFAALLGVTGIGFLVVLQALDSLQVEPNVGPPAAHAGQQPDSEPAPNTAPTPVVPPLETQEMVALGNDPFPPDPAPPRKAPPAPAETENPFAQAPEPSQSARTAQNRVSPADFPLEFPARANADQLPPAEPDPSDLPELPVLIPASNQTEAPDLEAFSQGQVPTGNPFPAPQAQSPPAESQPTPADDPFADPPRPEKKPSATESKSVPFDPYEPLPPGEERKNDEAANAPAFPSLPAPDANTASEEPTDPLDLNPPSAGPSFGPALDPAPNPGRASVQVSEEPKGEEFPLFPPAIEAPSAQTQPTQTAEQTPSLALPPDVEPASEVKAFPNLTLPPENDSHAEAAPAFPEPPVDPLDQLNFPESAPAKNEQPNTLPPEQPLAFPEFPSNEQKPAALPQIQPRPLKSEPPASPFPEPNLTESPAINNEVPPAAPGMEGVGVLESTTPSGPQQPELKIEKMAPPKAALGQPMIYHIIVKNVGESAAHEVIVEDQVPKGTQLTGTIPRGEMAESRLVWRLGVLQPGEEKKIAVRVIPTQEGQIGSVAKVSFVAEVTSRTVVAAVKLDLEFTGPTSAIVGDPVTYHFKLANTGTGDAAKVFLRNILPEGLNHPDGNDLEYEVGTLKAGEVKEIDLTVNAIKAGEFTNKAVLSTPGGAQKEAETKVKIIGDRLTITRTGPKRRYVGRTASFSNTVANQSDVKVAPVRVVEVIPAGMDFVEASANGQFDPQKRTVTWAIAELGPRQNQLLTLDLMAKTEGPQASEVIAYDPNGTRAVVQSETTVEGYAALRLDVREYAEPLDVGEQLGMRVIASNRGTQASTQVTVKMTIPDEMEFLSAKGPVDYQREGSTLTFSPVASLAAGQELEFELVLKSAKPGDARVKLEIGSDQMAKPLSREEAIRILATRP